jgi:hypothetical protein
VSPGTWYYTRINADRDVLSGPTISSDGTLDPPRYFKIGFRKQSFCLGTNFKEKARPVPGEDEEQLLPSHWVVPYIFTADFSRPFSLSTELNKALPYEFRKCIDSFS